MYQVAEMVLTYACASVKYNGGFEHSVRFTRLDVTGRNVNEVGIGYVGKAV
jgi:hypothetical protein